MKSYKIAVIAGDGIGPEVISEGVRVLECVSKLDGGFAFEFTHFPWGASIISKTEKWCRLGSSVMLISFIDDKIWIDFLTIAKSDY